jgi:hypothetical protein
LIGLGGLGKDIGDATLFFIGILFILGLNIYAAGFLSSIVGDIRDALSSIYKYNTFHRK